MFIFLILALFFINFFLTRFFIYKNFRRKNNQLQDYSKPLSTPRDYAICSAIWLLLGSCVILMVFSTFFAKMIVLIGVSLSLIIASVFLYKKKFDAKEHLENLYKYLIIFTTSISVITTIAIIFSISFESIKFFNKVNVIDFLLGTNWNPAYESDSGKTNFGVLPLLTGTFMVSFIAVIIAAPIGVLSAIYIAEYTPKSVRNVLKSTIEILAGIPSIIYGYFAILTISPFILKIGNYFNLNIDAENALAASIAMAIMIIPFILSLSYDAIRAIPKSLIYGSSAMGATKMETILKIQIPAALPGIVSSILLAISRAIGETMIVVMSVGMIANLTANPLDSVTTATVQIVMLLTGDQEFNSVKTLSAFALSFVLFIFTLIINIIAFIIIEKYREKYE